MDLTAYLHPGWAPLIRPAPATRAWMDATPDSFAYRCLPLNIANAHGWEILNPCGFEATWTGGASADAVTIRLDPGADQARKPVSLFGQGVVTFHVEAIMRTPPGWNLWIGGSPNRPKDGIAPLTGIVETDWSPFTFTMNWLFTRPGSVRFEAMEPFCFVFPVERAAIEAFEPAFASLDSDPATRERFLAWGKARDDFHARLRHDPPKASADHWQKHYYRGVDASGAALIPDHRAKLRLRGFDRSAAPSVPSAPLVDAPASPQAAQRGDEITSLKRALARREWLLETMERQRECAQAAIAIERRTALSQQEFLVQYYAPARPVILAGEMRDWPALRRWSPEYLKDRIGAAIVEYQDGRDANPQFEIEKERHRRQGPFADFIDKLATAGPGNDSYITAFNSAHNAGAFAPLGEDIGFLDKFLTRATTTGMIWIGPAGTLTALHHDLTNNFIAQIVGRKRLQIMPPSEVGKLANHRHVFSLFSDIEDPALDHARFPGLSDTRVYEIVLEPGEILFLPVAWWHQVRALDFSVTATFTNFHWPNEAYTSFPTD